MGWDTNLDPQKLPKIQKSGLQPPVLSMDDYVKFCARMRLEKMKHSSGVARVLNENYPVNVQFKI